MDEAPGDVTVECIEDVPAMTNLDWTDNCDAGGSVAGVDGPLVGGECGGTITRTWNVSDACGNPAETRTQIITVDDTTDPEIINVPDPEDLCNDGFPPELWADWTDNCADGGTISSGPPVVTDFECYQEAVYTFYVEDDCENSDEETVTIVREFDLFENCNTFYGRLSADNPPSQCFIDDEDYNFNRWGWTNYIENEGTYTIPLYAGAAHCDISNGAYVGDATVTYSGGLVDVEYQLFEGYVMNQAHVYIGCEKYPTKNNGTPTVAPGQYNFNLGSFDYISNYTLEDVEVDGPFWIIIHGVSCEETCRCSISNDEGGSETSSEDSIDCSANGAPTSVTESVGFSAYPVPFDGIVNIEYTFDYNTNISVEVFDIRGMLVKRLADSYYSNGTTGTSRIDLEGTSNQIYFIKLMTDRGVSIKKVVSSHSAKKK